MDKILLEFMLFYLPFYTYQDKVFAAVTTLTYVLHVLEKLK